MRPAVVLPILLVAGCSLFSDLGSYEGPATSDDAGGSAQVDASSDAGVVLVDATPNDATGAGPLGAFEDKFDRPNGVLGNGWLEKTPNTFLIEDNHLRPPVGNWRSYALYRPAVEDLLDVEISTEFMYLTPAPCKCDPALIARYQPSGNSGEMTTYALYIDDMHHLVLSRSRGSTEIQFETIAVAPVPEKLYRITMQVQGTDPVKLAAVFERRDDQQWARLQELNATDATNQRISQAGSVGYTGDEGVNFRFDNFARKSLP